jgi:site-specific recombinase XerD
MPATLLDLSDLLVSWMRHLRGARRSVETQRAYQRAVEGYLTHCTQAGVVPAELTKTAVVDWLAAQQDSSTATVRLRLAAIKQFAQWLATEEGFDADPITAVRAPQLEQDAVPDLTDAEIARLLKACDGPQLRDKRDRAMVALLAETGLRAAELLALDVTDLDLDACLVTVTRGKGGKSRRPRFSPATAAHIDRYLRARRKAVRHPAQGPLWISSQSVRLSYSGLTSTLKRRAADAGVADFHVHRLRHSAAVRWMAAGGSQVGLMAHAGWSDPAMVHRYVKAASERLAAEEFDRLGLGVTEL